MLKNHVVGTISSEASHSERNVQRSELRLVGCKRTPARDNSWSHEETKREASFKEGDMIWTYMETCSGDVWVTSRVMCSEHD